MLSTQSEGTPLTHAEPAHHLVWLLGWCGHAVRNSIQPPMTHRRRFYPREAGPLTEALRPSKTRGREGREAHRAGTLQAHYDAAACSHRRVPGNRSPPKRSAKACARRSQCHAPCRPTARRGAAISGAGLQGRSRPRASSPLHRDQPPGIDLHPFIHLDRKTAPQC